MSGWHGELLKMDDLDDLARGRMLHWAKVLGHRIKASHDDLSAAYAAALWVIECATKPDKPKEPGSRRGSVWPIYAADIAAAERVIAEAEFWLQDHRDRRLLRLLAGGKSQREVAKKIGISQTRVRQRRDAAWKNVARMIGKSDERHTGIVATGRVFKSLGEQPTKYLISKAA
jgi:hypothetical protein